jgi:hypothetical protein
VPLYLCVLPPHLCVLLYLCVPPTYACAPIPVCVLPPHLCVLLYLCVPPTCVCAPIPVCVCPCFWVCTCICEGKDRSKTNPIQAWTGPEGSKRLRLPEYIDNRHMKVAAFTPQEIFPGTHFCYRLIPPQGHNGAGRIKSVKNPNGPIGNRTRELPAFSAVAQPTAPPPPTCIYVS